MSPKQFFAGLAITSIVQIIVSLILIVVIPVIRAHAAFIAVSIASMIFFSMTLYAAAKVYARSSLNRLYIQLIMVGVFLKMLLCIALIVGYKKGFDPVDHSFIWPFLVIYITSTIYEVIYMERVGREKNPSKT